MTTDRSAVRLGPPGTGGYRPLEPGPGVVVEKTDAPFDRGSQRPLALGQVRAAGRDVERPIEAVAEL